MQNRAPSVSNVCIRKHVYSDRDGNVTNRTCSIMRRNCRKIIKTALTCSFVVILLKLLLNYWQGDRLSHYRSQESSPVTVKVEPQQPLQKPPFVDIKHAASRLESMLKDWTNRDYLEQEKLRKGEFVDRVNSIVTSHQHLRCSL